MPSNFDRIGPWNLADVDDFTPEGDLDPIGLEEFPSCDEDPERTLYEDVQELDDDEEGDWREEYAQYLDSIDEED